MVDKVQKLLKKNKELEDQLSSAADKRFMSLEDMEARATAEAKLKARRAAKKVRDKEITQKPKAAAKPKKQLAATDAATGGKVAEVEVVEQVREVGFEYPLQFADKSDFTQDVLQMTCSTVRRLTVKALAEYGFGQDDVHVNIDLSSTPIKVVAKVLATDETMNPVANCLRRLTSKTAEGGGDNPFRAWLDNFNKNPQTMENLMASHAPGPPGTPGEPVEMRFTVKPPNLTARDMSYLEGRIKTHIGEVMSVFCDVTTDDVKVDHKTIGGNVRITTTIKVPCTAKAVASTFEKLQLIQMPGGKFMEWVNALPKNM